MSCGRGFFFPKHPSKGKTGTINNLKRKEKEGFFLFFSFMDFISWGDFYAIFLPMPLLSLSCCCCCPMIMISLSLSNKFYAAHTLTHSFSLLHTHTHTHTSCNLFWVKKCVDTISLAFTHIHALSALHHSISHRYPLKDSLTHVACFFTVKCKLEK